MTTEDDIALLERVPLFKRMGTSALRILAIGTESYSVQAGEVLFSPGESADCAYVVQQGSFTLKPERLGEPESIAGPSVLLGETALLVESPRLGTAIAQEDSVVLRISRSMFLKMLENNPEAAQRIREVFAGRAEQSAREMDKVRDKLARGTGPQS
jgi:CRP-like cAMP-binding protein